MGTEPYGALSKLSDELIVPNLDQDISFFYDPTTRKLRKRFEMYPEALQATVKFAHMKASYVMLALSTLSGSRRRPCDEQVMSDV